MKMRCPHCETLATIRTSRQISNLTRESYYGCNNAACGHVFAAVTEINRTVSPSAIPNPGVLLPVSAHLRRRVLIEQLQTLPTSPIPPPD
jgi:hypothetical protein